MECPDHPGPLDDAAGHVCRLRPAAPKPPPDDMPVEPAKWAALTRAERRALIRHHRKVTRVR